GGATHETQHAMAAGRQERQERAADEPRRAGDRDGPGAGAARRVRGEVVGRRPVAPCEEPLEEPLRRATTEERADRTAWQRPLDAVLEHRVRAVGLHAMGVHPPRERAVHLLVAELAAG